MLPLLGLLVYACDGLFEPAGTALVPESRLTFVRVAVDAPPLTQTEVSFYVKRGETREVQLRYDTGYANGNGKCLLFRVPADAPLRHADGRPFSVGDSARVTIRVLDPKLFVFQFDPAGLKFDPNHPAELEIRYRWADADYNGDGVIDNRDTQLEQSFGVWRQEQPGAGWEKIPTVRRNELMEAHARVTGFTKYALASN